MRALPILALLLAIPVLADPSGTAKRDAALRAIHSCLQQESVSSRQCRKLNANLQILEEAFRQGDRLVLLTLFKFPYLTDFFGDALLADPVGFLTQLSCLPPKDEKAAATGLAGGIFFRKYVLYANSIGHG